MNNSISIDISLKNNKTNPIINNPTIEVIKKDDCIFQNVIKKSKKVNFSDLNEIYLIHTNDEIKEMYKIPSFERNIHFLPLKRQDFVFELNTKKSNDLTINEIFDIQNKDVFLFNQTQIQTCSFTREKYHLSFNKNKYNEYNNVVFKEKKPNSLFSFFNELGFCETNSISPPNYELIPINNIPTMFNGIKCHRRREDNFICEYYSL
jgi:hypothetical protein